LRARDSLREAGQRMADQAAPLLASPDAVSAEALNAPLRDLSARVLADFQGVEGGFYVVYEKGPFAGYAYPTSPHPQSDAIPGTNPLPLEQHVVLGQIETSLDQGTALLRTEDVPPSRVIILTQPVGKRWPARLSVWLLYRLTGPEQLAAQLRRADERETVDLNRVLTDIRPRCCSSHHPPVRRAVGVPRQ
jgi:hypothetical protein